MKNYRVAGFGSRLTPIRTLKAFFLVALLTEAVFGYLATENRAAGADMSEVSIYAAIALGIASLVVLPFVTNYRTRDWGYTRGTMVAALLVYQLMGAIGLALSWISKDPIYAAIFCSTGIVLTLLTPPAYL